MVDKITNDTVLRKTTSSELLGRHLSNINDPSKTDAKRYFCYSYDASIGGPMQRRKNGNNTLTGLTAE